MSLERALSVTVRNAKWLLLPTLLVTRTASAQESPTAPVAIATAPSDRSLKCESAFIEHVYKTAKPSVVRITRPDGGLGTGFLFLSSKYVATALHVVDLGRDVRVEFPGGSYRSAEVVAWDEGHDVAILELSSAADAPPLTPREHIDIGAPVLAIGNPYGELPRFTRELDGLLNFSVSQGIVSAKSDALIQTDAGLDPGNSGGPIFSCDGQVVAVADRVLGRHIGFGVPIARVMALAPSIRQRRYRGRVTVGDSSLGVAWHHDAETYVGPYIGGSVVAFDRLALNLRFGLGFGGGDSGAPVVDRSVHRFFGELTFGHRTRLIPYGFPSYFTIGAGLLATYDRGEETRLSASLGPPGCASTACKVSLVASKTAIRGGGIMPLASAALELGGIEGSYGFALDILHPQYSTHRVLVGLSF